MMPGSFLASLQIATGLLKLSGSTLAQSASGRLSHAATNAGIAAWAKQSVEAADIELRIEGRERFDTGESFVLMSNHQSHLDIPVLFHTLSPAIRMVTKKELFAFPMFGRAMRLTGFVEVDRSNRARAIESLRHASEVMAQGLHVWIAPEGTRSRTGEVGSFKKGGFMLAIDTKVRILPIGLWGTRDVLPPSALLSHKHKRVAVVVGEPISPEGRSRDELMVEVRDAMLLLVERAKQLVGAP